MTPRRFILIPVLLLFLYLGVYTWNQRTGFLDNLSAHVGLEISGVVLKPLAALHVAVRDMWDKYLDLVGVREENKRLKADLMVIHAQILEAGEARAELKRLRAMLSLPPDPAWKPVGARVIAGRLGPNAALETVMLSRGYLTGGTPGTPLVTHIGLVGRVLRASPHTSTALLITDPGSRVAVLSQNARAPGILTGRGSRHPLEMRFVARNSNVMDGEVLVTSGLDGVYPKGIAVARVVSVATSDYSQFLSVLAVPLVDVGHLEEVLLLEPTGQYPAQAAPAEKSLMGPPSPRESASPPGEARVRP